MTEQLFAMVDGQHIATLFLNGHELRFEYQQSWLQNMEAYPLSLSLPLHGGEASSTTIENVLWNLLPDNDALLKRWGQRFHVSPRNVFALLTHVGEDCAGAVQYLSPKRAEQLSQTSTSDEVQHIDESDIAARLRELRTDASASRRQNDRGQFSLAGAQAKIALYYDGKTWGIPFGRIPTTHILKPPIPGFVHHTWNEHICLQLARRVGLPAADSSVYDFDGETAIVVERYDRARGNDAIRRIHQEDFCQALGVHPLIKYENQGGPNAVTIAETIAKYSSAPDADQRTFFDALIFNYLIAGTDAHAKNYALLFARGPQIRLAPLYDVASWLPYQQPKARGTKLAMKIGGEYRISYIHDRHWTRLANECSRSDINLAERVGELRTQLVRACNTLLPTLPSAAKPIAERLLQHLTQK